MGNKGKKKLKDFIYVFDNVLSDELCDSIINEYKDDLWIPSLIGDGIKDTQVRNCESIGISLETNIVKNPDIRKSLDDQVFEATSSIIQKLIKLDPNISISEDTGYSLLKYETGGFYTQHIDTFNKHHRLISCSFCLNDNYKGGEFSFFDGDLKYKLKKGSIIAFPSTYLFPHEILTVKKGIRYSIVTWFK